MAIFRFLSLACLPFHHARLIIYRLHQSSFEGLLLAQDSGPRKQNVVHLGRL